MFAVIQTIVTSLLAGRPAALIVTFVPARATSGFVFSACIVAAGCPAFTTGPGSAGTEGIAGAVTGPGSADATAGATSSASVASRPAVAARGSETDWVVVVFMVVVPSRFSLLRDDGERVVVGAGLAAVGLEADSRYGVAERVVSGDDPRHGPEPDAVRGGAVRAPVEG